MRAILLVGLLALPGVAVATDDAKTEPPRVSTVVLCETTPVDAAYALAIAEGYARILDPNAAPATCTAVDPHRHGSPPTGFDALLVVRFRKTDLDRPVFDGDLELSNSKGRWGECGFIAQRFKIPHGGQASEERLALTSAILPLAFDLGLIPNPSPNSPPDDLPPYDATIELPQPMPRE
jgi:hypothetical protein